MDARIDVRLMRQHLHSREDYLEGRPTENVFWNIITRESVLYYAGAREIEKTFVKYGIFTIMEKMEGSLGNGGTGTAINYEAKSRGQGCVHSYPLSMTMATPASV